MNKGLILTVGIVLGCAATMLILNFLPDEGKTDSESANESSNEPLYWVAPMDPNYRRDGPGKSPMGMDLVPVYEESSGDMSPGTVQIDPVVVNNLGVRTEPVSQMPQTTTINATGYVGYNEETLIHVHPRVEGWVEELYVKAAGEYVQKGEPLYALYSPQMVNAQEEFLLALRRNETQLIKAAKARLQALQMPAKAIVALEKNRTAQQTLIFESPQTGFVDNLNIREGFYVEPATTLMAIGSLEEVWVDVDVFAAQASSISVGLNATMEMDYFPGKQWQGQVNYIYPTLDPQTRTLKLRLRFSNPNYLLKPGMFASVQLKAPATDAGAIAVPVQALIRTGQQNRVVLVQGEGKFKSIEVEVGAIAEGYAAILSGLAEGDEVVTSAHFLLDSESSITSDFMRKLPEAALPESAWTYAEIIDVMPDERKLTLDHGPLDPWQMPAMMMDFLVAEDIDLSALESGMSIHIEVRKHESGMYEIVTVHLHHQMGDAE